MGTTPAMTNAGLLSVANQSNITGLGTISSGTWEGTTIATGQGGTGSTSTTYCALGSNVSGTLPVGNGGTGATSLTDGGILLGSGSGAITAMSVLGDGEMIVGDGTTDPVAESGATLRASIGCDAAGTDNSTAVTLGTGSHDYLSISTQEITLGAIDLATDVTGVLPHANIGNDAIDGDNIADDVINSEHYVAASIDNEHLADNAVDTDEIADDAVTYAKIQDVSATNTILGRDSAGAGVIEEITPASLRTMINVADGANAYAHPNHTGEVTSTADGATIIVDDIVDEANLKISNAGSNGNFLSKQSGDTGGLTWAPIPTTTTHDYDTVVFETQLANNEGSGEVLRYGSAQEGGAGTLHFLHTDGTWDLTDANAVADGGSQLLGIALGADPGVNGMLLDGYIRIEQANIDGTPAIGAPVFVADDATGEFDFAAPTGDADYVRIVGYCIDIESDDILLRFKPR